jgi:hypothetical protein
MRRADALQCWQLATRFDHASSVQGLPVHDMRSGSAQRTQASDSASNEPRRAKAVRQIKARATARRISRNDGEPIKGH